MHSIEENIELKWAHLKTAQIYVACSGGLDSIVLTSILHKLNFKVSIIHVNYQLRGNDSELDAKYVESFCKSLDLSFEKKVVNLNQQLENGGNLQELARNVRYDWFNELLSQDASNKVALAHHLNDQIETFFLNLARKSGVMGMACMPDENNGIIRPLLDFSKEDLKSYAEENNIEWREDISNSNSKYRRNLLRNVILPELNQAIPSLNQSILDTIKRFQEKQRELELEVKDLSDFILTNHSIPLASIIELTELAYIELFRQLNQPASIALEIQKLNHKGTKVKLIKSHQHEFENVVYDGDQLTFLGDEAFIIPEIAMEHAVALPSDFTKHEIYLDQSKIKGELKLRKWKIGDRMAPIGMRGTCLISDIISDAKLNALEKSKVLVLGDDENIHWCVGLKVSRVAIAKANDTIIRLSLKEPNSKSFQSV